MVVTVKATALVLLLKVFMQANSEMSAPPPSMRVLKTDGQRSRFLPGFAICDCQDTVNIIC